jgi:hypothetical protein
LWARPVLRHRCGKERRLTARPIQPRRVRRRRSRANSIARSHKRQRARSRAIATDASPSFCAFARLVQELVNLSRCIMRLADGTGQHSGCMKQRVPQPAQTIGVSQRAIVCTFRDGWSPNRPTGYHDKNARVGGSASIFRSPNLGGGVFGALGVVSTKFLLIYLKGFFDQRGFQPHPIPKTPRSLQNICL